MQKPQLQIKMLQLDPLPEVRYITRKIKESYRFIDTHQNITLPELAPKWVNLWRINDEEQLDNITEYPITHELNYAPSFLISMMIFGYIYVRYYRTEDFGDLHNFLNIYADFQRVLFVLAALKPRQRSSLPALRVFDLENLSGILDELNKGENFNHK